MDLDDFINEEIETGEDELEVSSCCVPQREPTDAELKGVEKWLRDQGMVDEADALKDELEQEDDPSVDSTNYPAEDQGSIEEDLTDALGLCKRTYEFLEFLMDPELCRDALKKMDPTLVREGRVIMAELGNFLNTQESL